MATSTEALGSCTTTGYDFETPIKTAAFTLASYLTDPVCKIHELYRRLAIVQPLHPTSWQVTNLARKASLCLYGLFLLPFALGTLPGIILRSVAANMERQPYIHWTGAFSPLQKKPDYFTLFTWNAACTGAGYVITDAGVMPWPFRMNAIAQQISQQNADVVCLSEIFDIKTALQLYEKLKDRYAHFYFNIGPRALGVSSGLFIASKYDIQNPSFIPFPKEMLDGRTRNAEKGILSFDLGAFATLFTTHLQHSEEPARPTQAELTARQQEMGLLAQKVSRIAKNRAIVLTGDLNMDNPEYLANPLSKLCDKGMVEEGNSWGGDTFCASLVGRQGSGPLNLDHTMVVNNTATIKTTFVTTQFNHRRFDPEALSDHAGLLSLITLKDQNKD